MGLPRRYRTVTCVLCGLAGAVAVLWLGRPVGLDGPILDLLIKTREIAVGERSEATPVAVVALDRRTLDAPELARYPRALMAPIWAAITETLLQAKARAIGFDLLFVYNANQFSPGFETPFLDALDKHRAQLVLGRTAATLPASPFLAVLRNDPAALGFVEVTADSDGRYRRVLERSETTIGCARILHGRGAEG